MYIKSSNHQLEERVAKLDQNWFDQSPYWQINRHFRQHDFLVDFGTDLSGAAISFSLFTAPDKPGSGAATTVGQFLDLQPLQKKLDLVKGKRSISVVFKRRCKSVIGIKTFAFFEFS